MNRKVSLILITMFSALVLGACGSSGGGGGGDDTGENPPPPPPGQVAAPTFTPNGGTFTTYTVSGIAITSTTTEASIRYTTDGSTPTSTNGTVYSAPIWVLPTTTVKAIAYLSGMTDSNVAAANFRFNLGLQMISIYAAGDSFTMGDGSYGPDVPQTISYNFKMLKQEITNAQFQVFIDHGGYYTVGYQDYWTTNGWAQGYIGPEDFVGFTGPNQPRVGVSWYEAVAFSNWLSLKEGLTPAYNSSGQVNLSASGYRLPTEVEWEYAAAKGASTESERIYSYGSIWDCNKTVNSVSPCSNSTTANVELVTAADTPQGLSAMSGNAQEWLSDNQQDDGDISSGTDRYFFIDDQRLREFSVRGGSWFFWSNNKIRVAYRRFGNAAVSKLSTTGFRVVRPLILVPCPFCLLGSQNDEY